VRVEARLSIKIRKDDDWSRRQEGLALVVNLQSKKGGEPRVLEDQESTRVHLQRKKGQGVF
jgi:hypothetical protein